jgi:hypothetical protein
LRRDRDLATGAVRRHGAAGRLTFRDFPLGRR